MSEMTRCRDRGGHVSDPTLPFSIGALIEFALLSRVQAKANTMVLAQPPNQHVMKAFNLSEKGRSCDCYGGARGIGLEVSKALAEAGANVALIYHTSNTVDTISAEIASTNNVRAAAYKANVAIQSEIEAVVQQIKKDFGKLDIMVVNSGIASNTAAKTAPPINGVAGRIFKAQGRGNVIFMASFSATLVNLTQKQAAYNASKAGVVQLAKCLSIEWVDYCRVNCISPGYIATEILNTFPKEWRDKWFDLILAKRMAESYEFKGPTCSSPRMHLVT
ncbi:Short-chain dehydrogenase/reductase SDR [Penicillium samsonianum]|uniref:Short-chain dehydrogenase/reductase SDR n=1 Tax=Penicillium samsonianum TaxID=1882272 RepID=UPI002546C90A|nr:Short-chain dehydrogenase/reductase SDR [Penicillium samsonianum]KAJ6148864.1 Short-chain dehydrogenase/reductase SDR [Penicillium samsonianum]